MAANMRIIFFFFTNYEMEMTWCDSVHGNCQVDFRPIILKWILQKYDSRAWAGYIWLDIYK